MPKKIGLSIVLFSLALLSAHAAEPKGRKSEPPPKAKKHILFVTRSAGFKHSVVPFAAETMKKLAEQEKDFDVTVTDDPSVISKDGLKNYDALLFYTTGKTTEAFGINEEQKQALMDFVKSGKGFAGVHSATDTFYDWPEYGEMIGGFFDEHPWHQEVTIKVEDAKHPATRHLGASFRINDEIYQFKNFSRSRVHVLLSLDTSAVDLTKKNVKRTDGDFATSWVRDWGKGRVFYTALGHEQAVWSDPRFQTHLLNGIRWTMRTIR